MPAQSDLVSTKPHAGAFLVVFRKLPELDTESRISTWLYAICLRVASDWRRRVHRRYELLDEDAAPLAIATTESPASTELRALLGLALEAMPLDQRAVFHRFQSILTGRSARCMWLETVEHHASRGFRTPVIESAFLRRSALIL